VTSSDRSCGCPTWTDPTHRDVPSPVISTSTGAAPRSHLAEPEGSTRHRP
jgi:hypothetical protein